MELTETFKSLKLRLRRVGFGAALRRLLFRQTGLQALEFLLLIG